MKRAVITGSTGMIGSALCRVLLSQGAEEIAAVMRPMSAKTENLPNDMRIRRVECPLSELNSLPSLLGGRPYDAFFHLAWSSTFGAGRNDLNSQINNISSTVAAVNAAAALGCIVFAGAGSQAEYGRTEKKLTSDTPCFPENGYGMAKLCAGQMSRLRARQIGIRHVWIRFLSVYGPGDNPYTLISSAIDAFSGVKAPAFTKGEQIWDYLYCDDAARGMLLAAENGADGKVYPIGCGQEKRLSEYILAIRDAIDPGRPDGLGLIPYPAGQVMHLTADLSDLTADTGFSPQVPFETGIRNTILWKRAERK